MCVNSTDQLFDVQYTKHLSPIIDLWFYVEMDEESCQAQHNKNVFKVDGNEIIELLKLVKNKTLKVKVKKFEKSENFCLSKTEFDYREKT